MKQIIYKLLFFLIEKELRKNEADAVDRIKERFRKQSEIENKLRQHSNFNKRNLGRFHRIKDKFIFVKYFNE